MLVEKGLLTTDQIDAIVERYERDLGPQNGARVVARAWVDAGYRERLLADGAAAIGELGYGGFEGDTMVVVENTPTVHNVVVCTLCSCYPWPVLGLPPTWYKSPAYRARVVAEPRAVLREFGLELPCGDGDPRVGLDERGALPRRAGATAEGTEGMRRGAARGARHARQHDRHRRFPSPAGVSGVDPDRRLARRAGSAAARERRARLRASRGRAARSASPSRCTTRVSSTSRRSVRG